MSRSCTPPVTVSPMRPMHTYRFDALDRWLAAAEMKTSPELFIRSPLPDGDAMCEIYVSRYLGLHGQVYMLSLGVYHPRVAIDHATPDIELARFVGSPDDPGAPIWVRRLPLRTLLRFPQPLHLMGRVLKGMTDIPLGPILWKGPGQELRLQLCFDNWVRDALAIAPTPPTPKPIRRRFAAAKWIVSLSLFCVLALSVPYKCANVSAPLPSITVFLPPMAHYQKNPLSVNLPAVSIEERPALNETVNVDTAVKTVEVPADMQTEALAVDEHTTTTKTADVSAETDSDEQARQYVFAKRPLAV
ncbi:hypothetical protein K438DRAFT_1986108 [Mycena galopus ATCC 62051]|nr:hypothetical protein K438DRAFT_1986108 [Mycena galopus ATCC 62051]